MVRDILNRAVRMLSKYYELLYSIEILVAIIYWKVKNESILIRGDVDKNELIRIVTNLVEKESNDSEIGITFLNRLKSMNEDVIYDIKNIIHFIHSIELDSFESKQNLLNEFIEVISLDSNLGFNYFTPPEIVEVMKGNIQDEYNSFYDPYKRSGEFLVNAYRTSKSKVCFIVGSGDKPILNQIQQLRNVIFGIDKIFKNEIKSNDKFDLIITNPPFGKNEGHTNEIEGEWNNYISSKRNEFQFLKHCLNRVDDNGKVVILLPDSFLFSNELKIFRERALADNIIKSITLLPKVFYGTSVNTCIVEFCFKKSLNYSVNVTDLREDSVRLRNREVISSEIIQEINNKDFNRSNNLRRYRIFNYEDFKKNDFDFNFIKEVPEIVTDIDLNREMEKLIKERKEIIKQLKKSQAKLNKFL
jgi:type I restriction-modification system DNA methylase subunit